MLHATTLLYLTQQTLHIVYFILPAGQSSATYCMYVQICRRRPAVLFSPCFCWLAANVNPQRLLKVSFCWSVTPDLFRKLPLHGTVVQVLWITEQLAVGWIHNGHTELHNVLLVVFFDHLRVFFDLQQTLVR